jgi:HSP20 family protein
MVLRFDPFRDLDRITEQMLGAARAPRSMPMDVYREADHVVVHFDLPGVDPGSVDLTAEDNVLTLRAERTARSPEGAQYIVSERATGSFSRQLVLGEGLDLDRVEASYDSGVLTLTIPVAERAKARKIEVSQSGEGRRVITGAVESERGSQ